MTKPDDDKRLAAAAAYGRAMAEQFNAEFAWLTEAHERNQAVLNNYDAAVRTVHASGRPMQEVLRMAYDAAGGPPLALPGPRLVKP